MTNAYYLNQFISTTLSTAGGIDDSQTTGIKIASTSGVTTDKPGILCLSYSDPIDITKAEWISYTSIDVFNELQGVTRGEEGFSAKAHSNGVTVAFPISRSHINNLNDALIIGGVKTNLLEGILDEDDMASNSATKGVTQQSMKAYSDSATQTLTNKTLTSPVINNATFTGGGSLLSKVLYFGRDLSLTGDVSYTGIGFTPTAIIAFASVDATFSSSWAMADSSKSARNHAQYAANTFTKNALIVQLYIDVNNYTNATIKSYDADGFTLTWTKNGSPTGTGHITFLCFR